MKMLLKNLGIISFLILSGFLRAQVSTTVPLPKDVVYGKLENGMTYYIKHNKKPKGRVSFYFPQNVGAVLEEDNQDGLAHFLEHMAFNGSENFKGRAIDDFTEKLGLAMGRDVNAYTSLDETLYYIGNVPTKNQAAIDKCLLILHDWSGSLLLEDKDIDDERGVISEEWRQGRDEQARLEDKIRPVMYEGSKYSKRDIIGDLDFIKSFPYQALRDYYEKWYRPDLQAIVVVGDIDVSKMEEKIKVLFSKISSPQNPQERPYFKVPNQNETSYVLATDKESAETSIMWNFRAVKPGVNNMETMRNDIVNQLFMQIINARLEEKSQKPESAAEYYECSVLDITLKNREYGIYLSPKPGKELKATEDILFEIGRVAKFGLSSSELEREKRKILNEAETAVSTEKTKENSDWANELSYHFLQATPVMKAADYLAFTKKTLASIMLEEVNKVVKNFENIDNSYIVVTGPQDDNIKYPSKEDLLNMYKAVQNANIENYQEDVNNGPLITKKFSIKPIKEKFNIKSIDKAEGYILANGVKVALYPSKEKKDYFAMRAISFGGISKIALDEIPSAEVAFDLSSISGLGDFSASQLSKKLAGRNAELQPFIESYTEGFQGSSTKKDFELLMKLTYLSFEQPRFDKALLEARLPSWKEALVRSKNTSDVVFSDTVQVALSNGHPRAKPSTLKLMNTITYDKIKEVYTERFADANDFVFVFTGNFKSEEVLPLIQKYLGNLNTEASVEKWIDHNITPKDGTTFIGFNKKMPTPKTTIFYNISNATSYNFENKLLTKVVASLLSKRYNETIREEEGGSYGVAVYEEVEQIPKESANLSIYFDCNPQKKDKLIKIMKEEINKLIMEGPNEADLDELKKSLIKDREEAITTDEFWMSNIVEALFYKNDYVLQSDFTEYVENVTQKKVHDFTKKFMKDADIVEVILSPEKN